MFALIALKKSKFINWVIGKKKSHDIHLTLWFALDVKSERIAIDSWIYEITDYKEHVVIVYWSENYSI